MANRKIYPHELAAAFLVAEGVKFDDVYNNAGGRTSKQLSVLLSIPYIGKDLAANAYKTIKRFTDSTFSKEKENTQKDINQHYDFTANIESTLVGTTSTAIMEGAAKEDPGQLIKWLPSSADEQDIKHALEYGRTMTMETALKKGLGTRYGCQCGFEILNDNDQLTIPLEN